jgi:predicted transcriptional regulator
LELDLSNNTFAVNNDTMTPKEKLEKRKDEIRGKLFSVQIPRRQETSICWEIGKSLGITGTTIQNYLRGRIGDGYMAEAIYNEFVKHKLAE